MIFSSKHQNEHSVNLSNFLEKVSFNCATCAIARCTKSHKKNELIIFYWPFTIFARQYYYVASILSIESNMQNKCTAHSSQPHTYMAHIDLLTKSSMGQNTICIYATIRTTTAHVPMRVPSLFSCVLWIKYKRKNYDMHTGNIWLLKP